MIYKFELTHNFDGKGNRAKFVTHYFRQSAIDLQSSSVQSQVIALLAAERALMFDNVHFMQTRCIRYLNDDHTRADGETRVFGHDGPGTRPSVGVKPQRELCLVVRKNTNFNRSGFMLLRGCLNESDIVRSVTGGHYAGSGGCG